MPAANAVFEGGGVKGIGLVGALAVAEERGYTWQRVAGTSAGAIVAALVAVGYTAAEITGIMEREVQYRAFMDRGWGRVIPFPLWALLCIWFKKGIYNGRYAIELMDRLLSRKVGKADVTFRDLAIPCQVIAADVTNRRLVVLPDDLKLYGMEDPQDCLVSHAVRASMSIPIFFTPYHLQGMGGGQQGVTLVDGGMLSNFPVWLFDPQGVPPTVPTFGFYLQSPDTAGAWPTGTLTQYLHALVATALDGRDDYDLTHQDYARTIVIDTGDVGTTDFDLSAEQRIWLFNSGRRAAAQFLDCFDFCAWLEQFAHQAARKW